MVRLIVGKMWVVEENLRPTIVGIRFQCSFDIIRCSVTSEKDA